MGITLSTPIATFLSGLMKFLGAPGGRNNRIDGRSGGRSGGSSGGRSGGRSGGSSGATSAGPSAGPSHLPAPAPLPVATPVQPAFRVSDPVPMPARLPTHFDTHRLAMARRRLDHGGFNPWVDVPLMRRQPPPRRQDFYYTGPSEWEIRDSPNYLGPVAAAPPLASADAAAAIAAAVGAEAAAAVAAVAEAVASAEAAARAAFPAAAFPAAGAAAAAEAGAAFPAAGAAAAGPVDTLPWLFPAAWSSQPKTDTIYMNLKDFFDRCEACGKLSRDHRGTHFRCCGALVCSVCTDEACSDAAERLRIDLRKSLANSGRVLDGVRCPSCRTPSASVGFPFNSWFDRKAAAAAAAAAAVPFAPQADPFAPQAVPFAPQSSRNPAAASAAAAESLPTAAVAAADSAAAESLPTAAAAAAAAESLSGPLKDNDASSGSANDELIFGDAECV